MPLVSNSVVLYFRLLTCAQIRADPDSYEPFLLDFQMELAEFCESWVEAMGAEAGLSYHSVSPELTHIHAHYFPSLQTISKQRHFRVHWGLPSRWLGYTNESLILVLISSLSGKQEV